MLIAQKNNGDADSVSLLDFVDQQICSCVTVYEAANGRQVTHKIRPGLDYIYLTIS